MDIMQVLRWINFFITLTFTICYTYQFVFIPIVIFFKKKKRAKDAAAERVRQTGVNDYAVLICARNEQEVIGDLLASINNQTYPTDKIHVFVMADNCDDDTAGVAAQNGAIVYTRNNKKEVGKGYALQALLGHIRKDFPKGFEGYFVFDADNVLADNYIEKMDDCYCRGNDVITSYRNSKNYGSNWISAGYALWFLRESRYLNQARYMINSSAAVSGTGFMFGRSIADEVKDWPFHLLTEDIEFTIYLVTSGRKIAFCEDAVLFDEQPVSFVQSWNQRKRWAKGYLQVFKKYGRDLIRGTFKGSFSCFDMSMTIMPAFILSALSFICNISIGVFGALTGQDVMIAVHSVIETIYNMYMMLFAIGAITVITEWKHIYTSNWKKIWYLILFPVFMFTYLPIAIAAFFGKTTWKPINHTMSVERLNCGGNYGLSKVVKLK